MPAKILVVDDSRTTRTAMEVFLGRQGYDVITAEDALSALRKARTEVPDFVLLDIMMPGMDGLECCRRIKAMDKLKDTKVFMVTAKDERDPVKQAFRAGCDGYLTKPLDFKELTDKLQRARRLSSARQQIRELLKSE